MRLQKCASHFYLCFLFRRLMLSKALQTLWRINEKRIMNMQEANKSAAVFYLFVSFKLRLQVGFF